MRTRKIDFKVSETGCFEVTSHKPHSREGYREVMVNKVKMKMHRFIYMECHGEILEGNVIRHTCDNPNCINPEHLIQGTHADNMQDAVKRGRFPHRERSGMSKLDRFKVREIRRRHEKGDYYKDIIRDYGISSSNFYSIINKQTWSDV